MKVLNAEIRERIEIINRGEVPEGYKNTSVGIIPEDWEVKRLGETRNMEDKYSFTGGPFGSDLKKEHYTNNGIRILQLQNIGDGIFINDYKIYTSNKKADELYGCNIFPGEILIAKMADPLARACIVPNNEDRYLLASDGIRLKVDSDKYITKYIMEYINSNHFRNKVIKKGTGTTRLRIGLGELCEIKLAIPIIFEQQKIAQILSTWDQAMELKEKLIEEKKEQKKGLMQRLLTGEVRLPGFDGKWEDKELIEICKLETGKRPKGGANEIGDIPSLGGENINNDNGLKFNNIRKISTEFYNSMKQGKLKENDILINKDGANTGKVALYKDACLNKAAINEHLFIIRPKNKKTDYKFLYYYLASAEARNKMSVRITSSAQPGLNSKFINGFHVSIPSHNEQIRIGNVLHAADKEIDLLNEELEQLKLQKKGLMQLLLTGIIRVQS